MELLAVIAMAVTLAVPGRSNANVSLAADGRFVVATWAASVPGGPTDIFAAISRDGGSTFGTPIRVNAKEGDARANGEQPPHLALVARASQPPAIVVVWTAKREAGTVLLTARSDDGGRSFGATALVPGTDAPGNRGWDAIAVDAKGQVHALWLDHRELASPQAGSPAPAPGMHAHGDHAASGTPMDGVAMAQKSKLFVASLGEAGSAHAITSGVCYCCKTALVTGPGDAVFAAWRHVYPGPERDIAFSVSRDNGRTFSAPIRVSPDHWALNGCPDDGPAMGVGRGGEIHIIWPTLLPKAQETDDPTIGLFYASSKDGTSFTTRQPLPIAGQAHHPQLAMARDGLVTAIWDETIDSTHRIVLARGTTPGGAPTQREVLSSGNSVAYPVLAATGRGLLAAWTSGTGAASVIHVEPVESAAQGSR